MFHKCIPICLHFFFFCASLKQLLYTVGQGSPFNCLSVAMGAGASSLGRLRKAIVIRSYNLRKPNETVDEQFRKFARRGEDNVLYITMDDVRKCLGMEAKEYEWIENLFQHTFGGQVRCFLCCAVSVVIFSYYLTLMATSHFCSDLCY